ncbi:3837_t:CDS:10 [Diversispora eburnea]|uniref:3837_t:CDS:1 n=1 Tax=Diversispora eburnea TaxID=1213867 RepID=A0A9N8YNQ7_9GLOM|nr:3837_t:CDS:10 [Diversispora eburnea]
MVRKRRNQQNKKNRTDDSSVTDDTVSDFGTSSTASSIKRKSTGDSLNSEPRHKHSNSPEEVEQLVNETFFLKHEDKRPFVSKKRFVFAAGIFIGLIIAYAVMSPQNPHFKIFSDYLSESFIDLDFSSILPAHILVEELFGNITLFLRPNISLLEDTEFLPGLNLAEKGVKAQFPVVLIPGIVSTGLESWSTSNCSRPYFRRRMWGTTTMFRAVLLDKECWRKHMRLDPDTGLDPPNFKLRAAQGLDAADYLFPGYWVWGKMIQNFAAIGYDSNNMHLAAYDWRLSFSNLEVRDKYFSKLKSNIELSKRTEKKKTVIVSHSMGSLVALYFFKWVESPLGGNGGSSWVNDHVESFVNIGGPLLGLPKALSALLSGEMRDTVELGAFGVYVLERFFSKLERAELFRTWGGLSSMLPKGGDAIWGNVTNAPDDRDGLIESYGPILNLRSIKDNNSNVVNEINISEDNESFRSSKHTCVSGVEFLKQNSDEMFNKMLKKSYSFGVVKSQEEFQDSIDQTKWTNPLESQLPNAPDMKIFCLYGYGKDTERKYFYNFDPPAGERIRIRDLLKHIFIDNTMNSDKDPYLKSGVHNGEGDGTVPLLSLGFMCSKGWNNPLYNPAKIKVITREFEHETGAALDLRGGAKTADHVDILGNYALTEDVLLIASGNGDKLDDKITSNILSYVSKIDI